MSPRVAVEPQSCQPCMFLERRSNAVMSFFAHSFSALNTMKFRLVEKKMADGDLQVSNFRVERREGCSSLNVQALSCQDPSKLYIELLLNDGRC